MLTAITRFATCASAGARARSAAPLSDVWAVLAHPPRWTEFEPFVRSVSAWPECDAREDSIDIAAGQRLRAQLRSIPLHVPVEIDHVVNRSAVAVTARLLPGLAEEIEHLVLPSATGGTQLTVRITLHGPLALPALLPRWLVRILAVRLLARAAEAQPCAGTPPVPSVA